MTKLETYLAQVKERSENATDGPCEVVRFDNDDGSISWQVETHISADQDHRIIGWYSEHGDNPRIRHDAIFDAHSRSDIPKLLAIIEVYRDSVKKLGDASTDVFEQMLMGRWVDEMGHDVHLNSEMIELKDAVVFAIESMAKAEEIAGGSA